MQVTKKKLNKIKMKCIWFLWHQMLHFKHRWQCWNAKYFRALKETYESRSHFCDFRKWVSYLLFDWYNRKTTSINTRITTIHFFFLFVILLQWNLIHRVTKPPTHFGPRIKSNLIALRNPTRLRNIQYNFFFV